MTFRPYQQDAFDAIVNELQTKQKCIVKMFCGSRVLSFDKTNCVRVADSSGKSRIMHNLVKHYNLQLSVFVFPSLHSCCIIKSHKIRFHRAFQSIRLIRF
jgi:hypothetical protein